MSTGKYKGKKAIVIGGTAGIGLAAAKALVDEGSEVIVTGQNERNLESAKLDLGPLADVIKSDAASLEDISALATRSAEKFGEVDFVFINAGYCKIEAFDQVTEETYDRTFDINTKGVFFALQRLAPHVRKGGSFLLMTSIADEIGYPGMSVFSASRAAVRSFARVFGAELLSKEIRVNAISPGFIKTPTMGIAGATAADVAAFIREGEEITPMRRIGTLDEVVRAILFLGFEATFTTGAELTVDGGLGQGISAPHAIAASA